MNSVYFPRKSYILAICLLSLVVLGFTTTMSAQTCKISDNGDSVEIISAQLSGDKVVVMLGNDSRDSAANVTVDVEVSFRHNQNHRLPLVKDCLSGKTLADPQRTTKLEIAFSCPKDYSAISVKATKISGTKCK